MQLISPHEIDLTIRRMTGEHPGARPFLCNGSPLDCQVAVIGINPGTDTPFWPYWSRETGFDKVAWLADYRARTAGRRTPTRDRIEALIDAMGSLKVLELNLFHRHSVSEQQLADELRDPALYEFMLNAVRPQALFVHGRSPRDHLEKLLGVSLRRNEFTTVLYQGAKIELIVATKHLARVAGGEAYVRQIAERIKSRLCQRSDRSVALSGSRPHWIDQTPRTAAVYSLAALRAQYPAGRKVPLSEPAVAQVVAIGKYCSRCNVRRLAAEFAFSPQASTGLRSACKQCLANARNVR